MMSEEEDDAEDEQQAFAPVDDDPADVQRDGQGDQADAERDEDERLALGAGHGARMPQETY